MIHFDNFMPTGYQVDTSVFSNIADMIKQRDGLIAHLAGNNRIVLGVIDDGNGNYSEGYITHNGKPYRFIAGAAKPKLKIKRIAHTRADENGEQKPSHYEDVLEFSTDAAAEIVFSDLKRWYPNQPMFKEIKMVGANVTNASLAGTGWFIADGQNGTDNLQDMFVKAKGVATTIGRKGGSATRTLSENNIPEMQVKFKGQFQDQVQLIGNTIVDGYKYSSTYKTGYAKVGTQNPTAINIEPPTYIAVAIQFIGI